MANQPTPSPAAEVCLKCGREYGDPLALCEADDAPNYCVFPPAPETYCAELGNNSYGDDPPAAPAPAAQKCLGCGEPIYQSQGSQFHKWCSPIVCEGCGHSKRPLFIDGTCPELVNGAWCRHKCEPAVEPVSSPPERIWLTEFLEGDPRFVMMEWRTPDVRNTQPGDFVATRPHRKIPYVPELVPASRPAQEQEVNSGRGPNGETIVTGQVNWWPWELDELMPVVRKAAKEPCRNHHAGCPTNQPDHSYWCAPCSAREAKQIVGERVGTEPARARTGVAEGGGGK